ncbi:oxygen-independent coproporphyrinogen III oxidase [Algoriphagus sp.]|uniref:oxygen-independent coproporphyrinogen III oxidase n=1 Tax=Algoriphagus sp. TaxID=1872435 RepID=UPI0025D71015|nr:oxygen-independent coproporphyrinogen III oxidase [Algoriphagus sp.]
MALSPELIEKYSKPAPRYTSYPTVPFWENDLTSERWESLVKSAFQQYGENEGITLYIHLPYCENLCSYCGCNKRITKNHSVEIPYLNALLKEWNKYLAIFKTTPKLAGIHLGGGTPTFFKPESLEYFLKEIIQNSYILEDAEFSFEGHPNNTTLAHLETLNKFGFDRVSFGIQDFDLKVQQAIHRIQPLERVIEATDNARNSGYKSINFDLIYGLPYQTLETLEDTFKKIADLKPDRIAFYSYAHLPSAFPAQKSFEKHLPEDIQKRGLYEFGKKKLIELGYEEIGMDHFALPSDSLNVAKRNGTLHRNFMGYTTSPSKVLIGLGASSISDIHLGYAQNEKNVEAFKDSLNKGEWAIQKGHSMTIEDIQIREIILDLICKQQAHIPIDIWEKISDKKIFQLKEMEWENLVKINKGIIEVTKSGIGVIRHICMQLDLRLQANQNNFKHFSKAI